MFDSVFIFRRIALVITFTIANNEPNFQVMFNNYLSLACACYITVHQPNKTIVMNRLEIFNEIISLLSSYHLYFYTEMV
jgi:hypothetical protein